MSTKRLCGWVVLWLVICLVAASPIGAMLGFFAGFGVAIYGGLVGIVVQTVAGWLGRPLDWTATGDLVFGSVSVLLAVVLVWLVARVGLAARREHWNEARFRLSRVVHVLGACAALALSFRSLTKSWPM